jgi:hypothetical protein
MEEAIGLRFKELPLTEFIVLKNMEILKLNFQ